MGFYFQDIPNCRTNEQRSEIKRPMMKRSLFYNYNKLVAKKFTIVYQLKN